MGCRWVYVTHLYRVADNLTALAITWQTVEAANPMGP